MPNNPYMPLPGQPAQQPAMGPQTPPNFVNSAQAAGTTGPSMGNAMNQLQPMQQGYNSALDSLRQALDVSQNSYQGQQQRLGTQLQSNIGGLNQSLINKGLGNTTIAGTMMNAPYDQYNQAMNDLSDTAANRQMSQLNALAAMQSQGGSAISNYLQPYGEAEYKGNIAQQSQQESEQAQSALQTQQAGAAREQATLQGQIQGGLLGQSGAQASALQQAQILASQQQQQTGITANTASQQSQQASSLHDLQLQLQTQKQLAAKGQSSQQALQAQQQQYQQQQLEQTRQYQLQDQQRQQDLLQQQQMQQQLQNAWAQLSGGPTSAFNNPASPAAPTGGTGAVNQQIQQLQQMIAALQGGGGGASQGSYAPAAPAPNAGGTGNANVFGAGYGQPQVSYDAEGNLIGEGN